MQVARAAQAQGPAGVLGKGVDHVVEEADARGDGDGLRGGELGGVAGGEEVSGVVCVGQERERGKYLWEGKGRRERKAAYVLCRIIAAGLLLVQRVPEVGLLKGEQFPAVEVYRDLDLGLVCVAVEGGGSGHGC